MKTDRLAVMAVLCEIPQDRLEAFLDFFAEQELTQYRISAAQYILGLPTPVLGWVNQPTLNFEPSYAEARDLLAQWRKRCETNQVSGPPAMIKKGVSKEMRHIHEALEEIAGASRHFRMDPGSEANLKRLVAAEQEVTRILTAYDPPAEDGAGSEGVSRD